MDLHREVVLELLATVDTASWILLVHRNLSIDKPLVVDLILIVPCLVFIHILTILLNTITRAVVVIAAATAQLY